MEAEQFKASPIGRYLWSRAELEIHEAFSELRNADASNAEQIRSIQNRIYRGESFMTWIDEVIEEGINAARMASERED